MEKRFKRLLNKKGLSLIEILVVLFVSSVIILIATGMLPTVNGLLNSVMANAHLDVMCDTANEYIRSSVQNSSGVSIISFDNSGSVTTGFDNLKNTDDKIFKSNINVLAVLKNANGNFRLYDFGVVKDSADLISLINSHSDSNYGVFNDAFYDNSDYIITFGSDKPIVGEEDDATPVKSTKGWIKINSQCMRNGKAANQPRTLSFKILQGNADFVGTNTTTDMNNGVFIMYKENDYTKPKPNGTPSTPSPGDGDDTDGDDDDVNFVPAPSEIPDVEECITVSGSGSIMPEGDNGKTTVNANLKITNIRNGYFRINNIRVVVEGSFAPASGAVKVNTTSDPLNFGPSTEFDVLYNDTVTKKDIITSYSGSEITINYNQDILLSANGTAQIKVEIKDSSWWKDLLSDSTPVNISVYVNGTEIVP